MKAGPKRHDRRKLSLKESISGGHQHKSHSAQPLGREHMPTDYRISLDAYTGRSGIGGGFTENEKRIPDGYGPVQPLRGFEQTYQNIIDYIVRITHRIWEDRDVEYIDATYSDNSRVYDDYGLQLGNKKIIADTHHTTGAFSNIQLIADEVVWAGNDDIGFHTSHRTIIRGLNDGDSKYGPATGINVDVLVIANCVTLENEIFLEHVLYNNSSLLQQLGFKLDQMAAQMVQSAPAGWPRSATTWGDLRTATSPAKYLSVSSPAAGFDVDKFVRDNFDKVWNRGDYRSIPDSYAANFVFQGPTDRAFSGVAAYGDYLKSIRSMFPDLKLQVDEVYWMGNDREGYLTSERWSATGTHKGDGLYGEPGGCEVQIWGITQHKIINGRIVNEWMLLNELDLMMQIAAARR
jgi:predicted ester cyclase